MATAKQIAWRKKFAALSRAGKLPKRKTATKRAANPAGKTHSYLVYSAKGDVIDSGLSLPQAKAIAAKRDGSEIYVNKQTANAIRTVPYTPARKKNPVRKKTPRKALTKKKYVARPSQATSKPPTKRLKARRAANATPGYFPNPRASDRTAYSIIALSSGKWGRVDEVVGIYRNKTATVEGAKLIANKYGQPFAVKSVKVKSDSYQFVPMKPLWVE